MGANQLHILRLTSIHLHMFIYFFLLGIFIVQSQLLLMAVKSVNEDSDSGIERSVAILHNLLNDVDTVKSIASTPSIRKRKQKPKPEGYQNRGKVINRKKNRFLKKDKLITTEEAEKKAKEEYEIYLEKQRERSRIRSRQHKESKEFIRSIDPKLAKLLSRDPSTKRNHFIQRKEKEIRRKNQDIQPSDASKLASQMYNEFTRKRAARQRKYREKKKQKLEQANEDQQKDKSNA